MKSFVVTIGTAGAALLLLTGCETTGLSVRERGGGYPSLIHGLVRSRTNAQPAAKLQLPIRVAVGQLGETAPSKTFMQKLTRAPGIIASATPLPFPGQAPPRFRGAPPPQDEQLQSAEKIETGRRLAAEMGADYLMVIGGNIDSYSRPTPLSVLDLTVVGGAIIPSARLSGEGKGAGALIDVDTGHIVLMVNTDAQKTKRAPSYFAGEYQTELELELRDQLLVQLADELIKELAEQR